MINIRHNRIMARRSSTIWAAAFALAALLAGCSNQATQAPPLTEDVQATHKAAILVHAERMQKAFLDGDLDAFVAYLDPALVEGMGGAQKVKEAMEPKVLLMAETIEKTTMGEVSEVCVDGERLVALFPVTLECRISDDALIQTCYRIACSRDDGASWTFLESQGKPDQEALFKQLFPIFTERVPFPACEVRKVAETDGPEDQSIPKE